MNFLSVFGEATHGVLIRINPIEPAVTKGKGFGLRMGGLEGIRGLRETLGESRQQLSH